MPLPTMDEINLMHANICQAFTDPKRIMIMYALHEQPRHVTDLANFLDLPQPTVSRHLRVLRQRSLVIAERKGAAVYYRVADERMIQVVDIMRQVMRGALERQSDMLS